MKKFSPFRIDLANQCLWRCRSDGADELVTLAPRSFDVLRHLVENSGRLVTHDDLLSALWPGVHVQPEVIKGHILTLRNALDDDAKAPHFIETVRGRGYRFMSQAIEGAGQGLRAAPSTNDQNLVGRSSQIDRLRSCVVDILSGRPKLLFVVGEPGIGKTALIDHFIAVSAVDANLLVARGQCVEGYGGTEPFYPVLEALGRLCKSAIGETVVQKLISLAPTWALQLPADISLNRRALVRSDIGGAGRERMLREICDFFDDLSQLQPLLLVFEDLHWADYSTVDLVSAMARRRSRARVMVVVSYRSEDGGPGSQQIKQVSNDLTLRKLSSEIFLDPLTEEGVAAFLTGGEDRSVETDFARLVRDRSGGNPLFITATLDHLRQQGVVDRSDDGWRVVKSLAGQVDFGVPLTLSQVIEARIRHLSENERQVLQAASVVGVCFSAAVAASALQMDDETVEDVCEELCRKEDFIRRDYVSGKGVTGSPLTYSFRHALHRQVFYERQGPLRRARAHRSVGEKLESLLPAERRDEIASELAIHFAAAEDWSRTIGYLRASWQTAKRRFANREALEIVERATAVTVFLPDAERAIAELALLEARAAVYMVEHDPRAIEAYQQLIREANRLDDVDAEARALICLAYSVSWQDQQQAMTILDDALEVSTRQTDWYARSRTEVSVYAWRVWIGGWCKADAEKCEEAYVRLREGDDPLAAAWASLEYSTVAVVSTRYQAAYDIVKAGYEEIHLSAVHEPQYNTERAVWSYFFGAPLAPFLLGDFGKSLQAYDDGIAMFAKSGNQYAVTTLMLYRAWVFLHCRDFTSVIETCRQIVPKRSGRMEIWNEQNPIPPAEFRLCLLLEGLANAGLGEMIAAVTFLHGVERLMKMQPVIFDWYWKMPLERGLANVFMRSAQPDQAENHADNLLKAAQQTDDRTWQGLAWETKARVALVKGDLESAVQFSRHAAEAVEGFTTPIADWQIHSTAAAIYQAVGDREAASLHWSASMDKKRALAMSLPEGGPLRLTLMRPIPADALSSVHSRV